MKKLNALQEMKESLKTSTFQVSKRTLNIIAHQLLWLKNNTTLSSSWGDGTEGARFIMRKSLSPVETSVKVCNCMVPKTEMLWQDTAHKTRLPLCPQATVSKDNFSKHKDYSSLLHLPSYIWSVYDIWQLFIWWPLFVCPFVWSVQSAPCVFI